jgi:hypothetical protein
VQFDISHTYGEGVSRMGTMVAIERMEAADFHKISLFRAGSVSIGVELRTVPPHFADQLGLTETGYGVSIHVFDAADNLEYLRFDCFDVGFHYHYIYPSEGTHEVMEYDAAANGPLLDWALDRLGTRLPQMMERAGAVKASSDFDPAALASALPGVRQAARQQRVAQ